MSGKKAVSEQETAANQLQMPPWLQKARVVVCFGHGGAGKTTVSASLALAAAAAGRATCVLTMDPAHRLADVLGLVGQDAHQPVAVDPAPFLAAGLRLKAPLSAWMPSVRAVYDGLICEHIGVPKQREAILNNPLYMRFADALSGAHAYAAIEALHTAMHMPGSPLVVVDTPPSQEAVEILDAPRKLADFLDHAKLPGWLKHRGKLWGVGERMVLALLERVAGGRTLSALGELLMGLAPLHAGMLKRARTMDVLWGSGDAVGVWVTRGDARASDAHKVFFSELAKRRLPLKEAVLNRAWSAGAGFAALEHAFCEMETAWKKSEIGPFETEIFRGSQNLRDQIQDEASLYAQIRAEYGQELACRFLPRICPQTDPALGLAILAASWLCAQA